MDFNSFKVLYAINKYPNEVDLDIILDKVKLPKDDFLEILINLEKNDYIKFTHAGYAETTNKGKTYFSNLLFKWLINNVLAIIAIIISIIALFN